MIIKFRGARLRDVRFAGAFVVSLLFAGGSLQADALKPENLLAHQATKLVSPESIGIPASAERLLRDGDEASTAQLIATKDEPTHLLYAFGGETISVQKLRIKTKGVKAKRAKVEVLVSTVSATEGFSSLRVEPLAASGNWQSFEFEQTGAKWVMIKIIPFEGKATVSIAELELIGHVGQPVTIYAFDESPANALAVLAKLTNTVDTAISPDEASLFADAADGRLDQWSFAEASLLSSGITDPAERARYLKQIDRLAQTAARETASLKAPFQRGEALLKWLHANAFKKGYRLDQTDVATVLTANTFNCVSSATLYNIIARRMGLDVRGIEVPDHAFSVIYDGTNHADIETTTPKGFNPERNPEGLSEFQRQTGLVYIPDKDRSKRREVREAGLVAITYYNHGVELTKAKKYEHALRSYFKALSLDPRNKSAVKNILAVLANWSSWLLEANDLERSLAVLNAGLELAPANRTLMHNRNAVWQRKFSVALAAGDPQAALETLRAAHAQTQDDSFIALQSVVYTRQGEAKVKAGDFEGALALAKTGYDSVDPAARKKIVDWRLRVFLLWSSASIKEKKFAQAIDLLDRAIKLNGDNYRLSSQLAFAVQEWTGFVAAKDGHEEAGKLALALDARFPKVWAVQKQMHRVFDIAASKALKAGDYPGGIGVYLTALAARKDDQHFRGRIDAAWLNWSIEFIKKQEWPAAIDVLAKAIGSGSIHSGISGNIAYVAQAWSRAASEQAGTVAGEKVISDIAARFPNLFQVQQMRGTLVARAVAASIKARQFEAADKDLVAGKVYLKDREKYDNLASNLYYWWTKPHIEAKEWETAVAIYRRGRAAHDPNWRMEKNQIATWHAWADTHLKRKQWQQAIDVYKKGLIDVPGALLFSRNIAYCEQQLKR